MYSGIYELYVPCSDGLQILEIRCAGNHDVDGPEGLLGGLDGLETA